MEIKVTQAETNRTSPKDSDLGFGQAIFEGLKAYKISDKKICLFRARDNFERMNRSAKGMCIPQIDIDFVMDAMKQLIRLEEKLVLK